MKAARSFALRYANTKADEIHWGLIRVVSASVADTVIFPMQDILGLDSLRPDELPRQGRGELALAVSQRTVGHQAVRDRLADLHRRLRTMELEGIPQSGTRRHRPDSSIL